MERTSFFKFYFNVAEEKTFYTNCFNYIHNPFKLDFKYDCIRIDNQNQF